MTQNGAAQKQDSEEPSDGSPKECLFVAGSVDHWHSELKKQLQATNKALKFLPCAQDAEIKNHLEEADISIALIQIKKATDLARVFMLVSLMREPLAQGLSVIFLITVHHTHPQIEQLEKRGLIQILRPNISPKALRIKVDYTFSRMRVALKELERRNSEMVLRSKGLALVPEENKAEVIEGKKTQNDFGDSLVNVSPDVRKANAWNDKRTADPAAREWGNHLKDDPAPRALEGKIAFEKVDNRDFQSKEEPSDASQSLHTLHMLKPRAGFSKELRIAPVEDQHAHLVLISQREQDLKLIHAMTAKTGCNLHIFAKPSTDILQFLARYPQSLVFWDVDSEGKDEKDRQNSVESVGLMLCKVGAPTHVFALSDHAAVKIPYLNNFGRQVFTHNFLRKQSPSAIEIYTRIVEAAHSRQALGLERYFLDGSRRQEIVLKRTSQRIAAIGATGNFLNKQGLSPRLSTQVAHAAEELLLNALYCAPMNERGERYRLNADRLHDHKLSEREEVRLAVMSNEEYFGLSVTDQFGSLNLDRVLRNLQHNFQEEGYVPDEDSGPGLGLSKVLESGFSLLMVLDPDKQTEVSIFFPKAKNHRDFRTRFRFLSAIWVR
jgi:hypothetical protein